MNPTDVEDTATGVGAARGTSAPRLPQTVHPALLGAGGMAALLVGLEILPRTGIVSDRYLLPTSQIAQALADEAGDPQFWIAVRDTLLAWSLALLIAAVAGILIGLLIGSVAFLRSATASTIEFLRPIPSVALIPLAVVLFGGDLRASLLLAVYASFWQVLIQVLYGVNDVDPVAADTARSYGLGVLARIRHVVWPTALPYLLTGVRLAAAVALILSVTAELVIGSPGLGKRIYVAQESNATGAIYALVVVTGLLGLTINLAVRRLERSRLHWHQSIRGEAPQ